MQPVESWRELFYAANFVYTTVSKVDTRPRFRNLTIFQILVFFHKLTDSGPDSALGIMIASY
jgi:hypothetical protein